jgi:hypothetical protein
MPVINRPPHGVERYQQEDLVADAADQYGGWIGSTTDDLINSAVKMMLMQRLLAAAMGMELYFKAPFPRENVFLQVMALRVSRVHEWLFYSYNLFLFATPYTAYSILLSGLHVFGLTVHQRIRAGQLPP